MAGGIEVRGVRRAFGSVQAVDHIDLVAAPGEVTALIGPNGAGKTTLLLMLATLLVPDAGTIRIAGLDPVASPREVRALMGWMPDGFGTWDALTVREVLETVAAAYGIDRTSARARGGEVLELVHRPGVLLLDEPASGLDPRSRIELRDILRDLAGQGATVLVSSHILTELQEVADRAVIVAGGRSVAVEDVDGVPDTAPRRWKVTALDPTALLTALQGRQVPHRTAADGVEVEVPGEAAAAGLLTALVRDGIPVVSFAPTHGSLETAYLAATEERR